jgi:prepilin-type N-terminal cleavage/methylation domain-containing protein
MTRHRTHRTHRRALRARPGFTLTELMIVVVLLGLIGTMLTAVLVRQQRFHRAVMSLTDARARMRDVATILPTDLRSMSSVGNDILSFTDTSLQFRAFIGTSILCRYNTTTIVELPPKIMASGNVISAWINPPTKDDVAFIYNEGTEAGNADDDWTPFVIDTVTTTTSSTACPVSSTFTTASDNSAEKLLVELPSAPDQAQILPGAPIRFAREVRYSVYQASDGQWYVGFQRCTPNVTWNSAGECGTREVLAGPVKPATSDTLTSGLYFVYYNQTGGRVTTAALDTTIAAIGIGVRTTSESLRQATATQIGSSIAGGDSIRFTVGIRNRI